MGIRLSDDTERIYELRDEVSRTGQAYEDAASRPLPEAVSDESGSIGVNIDTDGAYVVTIGDGWNSAYEPGELAEGVVQTLQAFGLARVEGWASNLDSALDEERRNTPIPPLDDTLASQVKASLDGDLDSARETERILENLLGFLEDVEANLDSTFDIVSQRGARTGAASTETRNVSVEVTAGGDVRSLQLDEDWLSRSSGAQISRELTAALAQAHADAASSGAGSFTGTPLEKYQKFADDPEAFARYVRGQE
ncbi:hypothetical protein GCM10027515_28800 [Schumannella luteola]